MAKLSYGVMRPEYKKNPDTSRDPPTDKMYKIMRGKPGSKIWRKAREGKL